MKPFTRWIPLFILASSAVVLALRWPELPAGWAIHWGLNGQPNGWASKTPLGVFGLLFLGFFVWVLIEGALRLARDKGGETTALSEALLFTEIALALTLATISIWMPLGQPESPLGMVVVSLVVMGAGVVATVVRLSRSRPVANESTAMSDEGWNGVVYRNSKDERLWVPKRSGLGLTLNFAHRLAWPTLLLLLTPAFIAVLIVAMVAARSH